MHVHVYVHSHIHVYIRAYVHVHAYAHAHIHIRIHIHEINRFEDLWQNGVELSNRPKNLKKRELYISILPCTDTVKYSCTRKDSKQIVHVRV